MNCVPEMLPDTASVKIRRWRYTGKISHPLLLPRCRPAERTSRQPELSRRESASFRKVWDIFGVWQLVGHLSSAAQNAVQSSDGACITTSAQLYLEYHKTRVGVPPAEVCDLAQFLLCMLVWMVVWSVRFISKGLNITVVSALPAVDILTVHVVLDGCLGHAVLLSVVQKRLTKPHSLCYSIHGKCIVLSVLVLFEQLNYTTGRSIRLSFYLTL